MKIDNVVADTGTIRINADKIGNIFLSYDGREYVISGENIKKLLDNLILLSGVELKLTTMNGYGMNE